MGWRTNRQTRLEQNLLVYQLDTIRYQGQAHILLNFRLKPALSLLDSSGNPINSLNIQEQNMRAFDRFAVVLGLALACAQAQAVDFSFTSGSVTPAFGNTYTTLAGGLTVTASAWSDNTANNKFTTAELKIDPGFGMGVCSKGEKLNCTSKNFADALGNKDLILLSFSSAVSLQSLTMLQVGRDSDLSLWAGTGSFSPNGLKASALGTATPFDNANTVTGIRNVNLTAFTGTYDWLAVAARIGQTNDFAKLQSLTIKPVAQPVPEPDTWIMLLAGLGLVGFAVSRRTQA